MRMFGQLNLLIDIGKDLLSGFVGFGLGWIWQGSRRWLKFRLAKRFWTSFTREKSYIVLPHLKKRLHDDESSGYVSFAEAMGLAELQGYFGKLGLKNITATFDDSIEEELLKSNLILVGGPISNTISKAVIDRINSNIRFGKPVGTSGIDLNVPVIDLLENVTYWPSRLPETDELVSDYCVILRTTNPFESSKELLMIAGCFGYGSWAGLRFVASRDFTNDPLISNQKRIECLIKTDVVLRTPQNIQRCIMRGNQEKERGES